MDEGKAMARNVILLYIVSNMVDIDLLDGEKIPKSPTGSQVCLNSMVKIAWCEEFTKVKSLVRSLCQDYVVPQHCVVLSLIKPPTLPRTTSCGPLQP